MGGVADMGGVAEVRVVEVHVVEVHVVEVCVVEAVVTSLGKISDFLEIQKPNRAIRHRTNLHLFTFKSCKEWRRRIRQMPSWIF